MRDVKVLGSGCRNCAATAQRIEEVARAAGIEVCVEKVQDVRAIAAYGVLATPGVVVDGAVVHAGGVPERDAIARWLAADAPPASSSGRGCGSATGG